MLNKLRERAKVIEFDPKHHTYYHKTKKQYYTSVSERLSFKVMYKNTAVENGLIRGSLIHQWTEDYDTCSTIWYPTPPADIELYCEAYIDYINDNKPNYLAIEVIVYSDSWATAGTIDRIIQNPDGSLTVLDIKTGKYNAKHELQLQFYMLMLRAVLRVKKPIKKQLLYLTENGKYELREV